MSSSSGNKCVIVDLDGAIAKVGFAGECHPRFSIPFDLQSIAQDWDNLRFQISAFFQNLFYHKLHVKSRSTQILIIENLFWPKIWRDCIYTVLLYDFQVSSVCFQPSIYMGILSTGQSTGVLVSIQRNECQILCYAYHRPIQPSLCVVKGGYQMILEDIIALITRKASSDAWKVKETEVINAVLAVIFQTNSNQTTEEEMRVELPDHSSITFDATDCSNILESLWSGYSTIRSTGIDDKGIIDSVLRAISHCAGDLRPMLSQSIHILSSHPLIPSTATVFSNAFLERIKEGIPRESPLFSLQSQWKVATACHLTNPSHYPFLGASLFASLPANQARFVSMESVLPSIPKQLRHHATNPLGTLSEVGISPSVSTSDLAGPALLRREASLDHPEDEHQLVEDVREASDNSLWKVRLMAPDWLAVHPNQWVFYGPKMLS